MNEEEDRFDYDPSTPVIAFLLFVIIMTAIFYKSFIG